ncbi:hypothetical protein F511_19121 [Dorcoceras hygrometricum]|uniref:Uncharacterized protein n=1 Tax=Dorcoceras hygrometricum TaxID=472368 RepID=A0A2Z7BXP8_9LAMI|nr:hypothetical protein F511_19121 [Dorcoceras hygrometricum]
MASAVLQENRKVHALFLKEADALFSQIQQMLCFRKFSRCFAFTNSADALLSQIQQMRYKISRCVLLSNFSSCVTFQNSAVATGVATGRSDWFIRTTSFHFTSV